MRRRVLAVCACAVAVLPLASCGRDRVVPAAPAAAATAPEWTDHDTRSRLRSFLAALPPDWGEVSAAGVVTTRPVVVDVRQPEEYRAGFIAGALNIPIRQLAARLEALPATDAEIVVVCGTGHRAAVGMAVLQMLGYRKARSLSGGMRGWHAAKLPVVTGPVPETAAHAPAEVDAQLRAALDYYLVHTLPVDWGSMSPAALTEDQHRKSSAELEAQPETFDQGRSLIVDVDSPQDFAKAGLFKAINLPLRELPDGLAQMPLQETVNWA